MERLATEMHEVRDQVRKSRTQLDTVEARVNTLAETRTSIEHLRDAITGDLDRLGQRLEQQMKESVDRGESVPSGDQIANLSRRLRRSSIYLDRVLGRLDELVSYQTGGPPPNGKSRVAYPEAAELDR
jgi:septal ring factor EnvC (AmiA/AmiB activator)